MTEEKAPTAAFVLSLIGGIIVLIAGIVVAAVGAVLTFFLGGIGGVFGLLGVLWGILTIVSAAMLHARPAQHQTWGALIVVFSLLSWFGSFGGAVVGFVLGLIGGILGIVWHPAGSPPAQMTQTSMTRTCLNCGRTVNQDAKFCPNCGKALP